MSARRSGERGYRQLESGPGGSSTHAIKSYLPEGVTAVSDFLSNGARYYNDVGGKVEYSTPENISSEGVLISELAGELVVAESLRRYMAETEGIEAAFLCKRVVDASRTTWGYHCNIAESRQEIGRFEDMHALTTHLATSLPMLGGGAVYYDSYAEQYRYSFGQKVLAPFSGDFASDTTNSCKPLVNTRDEPHAEPIKYRRIHIVGVDPHISPWATWMSLGTMSLMLAATRQKLTGGLRLANGPEPATRTSIIAARDLDMRERYPMDNGNSYTALEIQERLIEVAGKVRGRTEEQDEIIREWQRAHEVLSDDPSKLVESDAIKKLGLIRDDLKRRGKTAMDSASFGVDLGYTMVFAATKQEAQTLSTEEIAAKSVAGKLRQRVPGNRMPDLASIRFAVNNPPETTRAYRRGRLIREGLVRSANWAQYQLVEGGKTVHVSNPLEGARETGAA